MQTIKNKIYSAVMTGVISGTLQIASFPSLGIWPLIVVAYTIIATMAIKALIFTPIIVVAHSLTYYFFGWHWLTNALHLGYGLNIISSWLLLLALGVFQTIIPFLMASIYSMIGRRTQAKSVRMLLVVVIWLISWDKIEWRFFPFSPVQILGQDETLLASVGVVGTDGMRVVFFSLCAAIGWIFANFGYGPKMIGKVALLLLLTLGSLSVLGNTQIDKLRSNAKSGQQVVLIQDGIGSLEPRYQNFTVAQAFKEVGDSFTRLLQNDPEPPVHAWYIWSEGMLPEWAPNHTSNEIIEAVASTTKSIQLFTGAEIEGKKLYNIVGLYDPKSGYQGHYRKEILFPFGEYIPGAKYIPIIEKLFPKFEEVSSDRPVKSNWLVDKTTNTVFVTLICYEVIFNRYVKSRISEARVEFPYSNIVIVNPSNDSRFDSEAEAKIHALLAKWNAVENNVPLLRATSTGVSEIVTAWGDVLSQSRDRAPILVKADLPVR